MSRKTFDILASAWFVFMLSLAVFAIARPVTSGSITPADRAPSALYDATGAREAAIVYPKDPQLPRPVYDATGAMLEAIQPHKATFAPVYDATGAMLAAIRSPKVSSNQPIGPVYDATGAMLDSIVLP